MMIKVNDDDSFLMVVREDKQWRLWWPWRVDYCQFIPSAKYVNYCSGHPQGISVEYQ